MTAKDHANGNFLHLRGLADSKTNRPGLVPRNLRRAWRLLPLRDRSLLTLLYVRGASQRELAGFLGINRAALRKMQRRATRKATDPLNLAILAAWRRLTPQERRLVYLHRFLGISLQCIVRLRLVPAVPRTGQPAPAAGMKALRAMLRKVRRKVHRSGRGDEIHPSQPR